MIPRRQKSPDNMSSWQVALSANMRSSWRQGQQWERSFQHGGGHDWKPAKGSAPVFVLTVRSPLCMLTVCPSPLSMANAYGGAEEREDLFGGEFFGWFDLLETNQCDCSVDIEGSCRNKMEPSRLALLDKLFLGCFLIVHPFHLWLIIVVRLTNIERVRETTLWPLVLLTNLLIGL